MHSLQKELNVVVADDDSTTRHALRLLLRETGCNVVAEAMDGEKAVELCALHKPDLAFIDIDMPKLDGHQASAKIRKDNPAIGTIIVTSHPTVDNVRRAVQGGVAGFVVKPFNALKVTEAVDNWIKRGRL